MDVSSDTKVKKMAYRASLACERTGQGQGMAVQGNIRVKDSRQKREVSSAKHYGQTTVGFKS